MLTYPNAVKPGDTIGLVLPSSMITQDTLDRVIKAAHSLGLKTIAEGVETEEQVNWLRKRGVRYCQGWFFAKAMPPQVFMQWMEQLPARELTRGQ